MKTLNGPLEVGLRLLVVLHAAYPNSFDVTKLSLLDHALLHSGDLNGPESIHPPVPNRIGELGIKRTLVEQGLEVVGRAQLVDTIVGLDGLSFRAGEEANPYLRLLDSPYVIKLSQRAEWVVSQFGDLSLNELTQQMGAVFGQVALEFGSAPRLGQGGLF